MPAQENDAAILCPKCSQSMHTMQVGGCTIDKCENCHGIFLDGGERAKVLQDKKTLKSIDAGSRELAQKYNTMQAINCPRCAAAMRHLEHPEQKHVGFEHCDNCDGSYFDSGELTELATFTFSDLLRFFPGLRK